MGIKVEGFHSALKNGDVNEVAKFIENGFDVNATNKFGGTPIFVAASEDNVQMIELLLKNGAWIEGAKWCIRTPLTNAANDGCINAVRYLASRGANINIRNQDGETPIILAARSGHNEIIEFLISQGVDVDERDAYEETPLHHAAANGHLEVAKILLSNGANVNTQGTPNPPRAGCTPLDKLAMFRGKQFPKSEKFDFNESLKIAELLLENGADPNLGIYTGSTFSFAKGNNDKPLMDLLVKYGVTPSEGGCYVATSVYGSYDCPQVWVLRRFRDERLSTTNLGKAFIKQYYLISPALVRIVGEARWFRAIIKPCLDRFVSKLKREGFSEEHYSD